MCFNIFIENCLTNTIFTSHFDITSSWSTMKEIQLSSVPTQKTLWNLFFKTERTTEEQSSRMTWQTWKPNQGSRRSRLKLSFKTTKSYSYRKTRCNLYRWTRTIVRTNFQFYISRTTARILLRSRICYRTTTSRTLSNFSTFSVSTTTGTTTSTTFTSTSTSTSTTSTSDSSPTTSSNSKGTISSETWSTYRWPYKA